MVRVAGAAAALLPVGPVLAAPADVFYRDVAAASGIDFVHQNGATGEKQFQESMGSGVALLDYDGDGRLDVYLVTSVGRNRLFRNLGDLRFRDVTDPAGVGDEGYGMGVVASDYDADGDPDLFVTNLGPNRLFRNDGGAFREIGRAAGVADPRFGAGAAFLDYDRDGRLDLFVANYVQVASPDTNVCRDHSGMRLYCSPRAYPRETSLLYRNRGDGTFENVSASSGIAAHAARGLGVLAADFDGDVLVDVYVANDLDPNTLFRNRGDGTFEEIGAVAGVSHSEDGMAQGSMGVATADCDEDGTLDIFVTNYVNETNSLYCGGEAGFFDDRSARSGLGSVAVPWVGWGTDFVDYDLDGLPDVLVVNGHTEMDAAKNDPTTTWKQPGFLYRNEGGGRFRDVTGEAAPDLSAKRSSRGAAFGDLDDDGDTDVVIVQQNGPAVLLSNVGRTGRRWIGFRLLGTRSNRDGVGARVEVQAGGRSAVRAATAGGSYLSSNDPRLLFGLGDAAAVEAVVVTWPSGAKETFRGLAPGRYHRLREGTGGS
jgi:hypothetical protein